MLSSRGNLLPVVSRGWVKVEASGRRPLVPLVSLSLIQRAQAWTFGHRGFGVATWSAARQNRTFLIVDLPCQCAFVLRD